MNLLVAFSISSTAAVFTANPVTGSMHQIMGNVLMLYIQAQPIKVLETLDEALGGLTPLKAL
jgi:hypothetical protein